MENTIEIPEGYKARIEGGMVIFEPKESEDEIIRKELIGFIQDEIDSINRLVSGDYDDRDADDIAHQNWCKKALAWLEKQGEQNLANSGKTCNVEPKFRVGDKIIEKDFDECGCGTIIDIKDGKYIFDNGGFICIEEQDLWQLVEQKSVDKVEPKFKVGDWITNGEEIGQVIEWNHPDCIGYKTNYGTEKAFNKEGISKWHKWTIQDAKDGDVLVHEGEIFMIKSYALWNQIVFHCCYTGKVLQKHGMYHFWTKEDFDNVHPATQEQRDLLFKVMQESDYQWDAEKKELVKIEQKPTIKDELFDHRYAQYSVESQRQKSMIQWKGDNLKEVIDLTGKDKNFDKWFKSFEEYEQYVQKHNGIFKLFNADGSHYEVPVGAWIVKTPDGYNVASKAIFKQNPAWSKEDEEMLRRCISATFDHGYLKECDWLKSFKERYTWKPSNEQMGALKNAAKHFGGCDPDDWDATLESLYNDLKKLKG